MNESWQNLSLSPFEGGAEGFASDDAGDRLVQRYHQRLFDDNVIVLRDGETVHVIRLCGRRAFHARHDATLRHRRASTGGGGGGGVRRRVVDDRVGRSRRPHRHGDRVRACRLRHVRVRRLRKNARDVVQVLLFIHIVNKNVDLLSEFWFFRLKFSFSNLKFYSKMFVIEVNIGQISGCWGQNWSTIWLQVKIS